AIAGEFVDASLGLLGEGGRFLEMGKTDVRDPERVAAEHPGVSYRAFDLSEAGPERIAAILGESIELLEEGALSQLPISTWDMRQAPAAFRHLREGENVGKVVLSAPRAIDPERTTLIAGATGALGAALARHLVAEHGARRLLLLSRSGAEAPGAQELIAELERMGAKAELRACDVGERAQLQELLAELPAEHPLGAVVHAAGALEDATLEGAWHLHELTEGLDLSAFVLFSSAAGVLGAPGQANYAAANAFCDALAQHRACLGLPATSIAWGPWSGGMTAGLGEADLARMARAGFATLEQAEGLARFDVALLAARPLTLGLALEPRGLAARAAAGELPPLLGALTRAPRRRSARSGELAAKLASMPEPERQPYALALVRSEVAAVLGLAAGEAVDPERAFKELGFDSLAAVELRNRLRDATGLRLAATVVFDHPSASALATRLIEESEGGAGASGVEAEWVRFERSLTALAEDDPRRQRIAVQVRALLATLEDGSGPAARTEAIETLESASDEELLRFVDEQMGVELEVGSRDG
ncbi:MAG TPA: SDR family NAD(P)-dependent oxidoreductase, partial [Solirubrobacterales bacterium]|nr:SDR family NAD(P)-dependent oxidoreductase [Solirubrobacterales bacterium]